MKKGLIITIAILVALLAAYAVVCNLLVNYALKPRTRSTEGTPEDGDPYRAALEALGEDYARRAELTREWAEATQSEAVTLTADDGLALAGTVYRQDEPSHLWAVCVHGYNSRGADMVSFAREHHERGYNVLLPDLRAHGGSGGEYITMGRLDCMDLVKWIGTIVAEDAEAEIVLHGISMGGATVMMASGEPLPANVAAIIDDCGYTSVWDIFAGQLKERFNMPSFPLLNGAELMSRLRAGFGFRDKSALEQVSKSVTPICFIHGGEDTFVPTAMLYELYEAASCDKELLVVEGAGHGMSAHVDYDGYWTLVFDFIGRYI